MEQQAATNMEQPAPANAQQPAEASQPLARKQDRVDKLIDALDNARNANHVMDLMGLRPSHLRRVLQCRRFQNWLSMQRQLTKLVLAHDGIEHLYGTMLEMFKLREARSEGAALKACMFFLNNALGDPFARDTNPAPGVTMLGQSPKNCFTENPCHHPPTRPMNAKRNNSRPSYARSRIKTCAVGLAPGWSSWHQQAPVSTPWHARNTQVTANKGLMIFDLRFLFTPSRCRVHGRFSHEHGTRRRRPGIPTRNPSSQSRRPASSLLFLMSAFIC
jgi:hypothetical protein